MDEATCFRFVGILLWALVGCRHTPAVTGANEAPTGAVEDSGASGAKRRPALASKTPATEAEDAQPPASAPATEAAETRPEADAAETHTTEHELCAQPVWLLGPAQGEAGKLEDGLRGAEWVGVAQTTLRQADCSGIGHLHLAFESPDAKLLAYARVPLSHSFLPRTPYYLLGAERQAPTAQNLRSVCIARELAVTARALWVLPLADEASAQAWRARLAGAHICGRTSARCRECSRECGTDEGSCCRMWTDSCPGPEGRYSTCAGFLPCDADCCETR